MRCLMLLALVQPLAGQFPLYMDLSGGWRLSEGDSPAFAQPDVDDSAWKVFAVPRRELPPHGIDWVRRRIEIPAGTDTGQLALNIGPLIESYEVFVNGQRIGKRGEFRLSKTFVARAETFDIPPGLARAGSPVTIALRYWRPDYLGPRYRNFNGIPDIGPYLLAYRTNAPQDVAAAGMRKRERLAVESLVMGVFNGVILLILLLAWIMERNRRDLLYLMGFLLTRGALRIVNYLSLVLDWSHMVPVISGPGLTIDGAFMALLALEITGTRNRWLPVAIWIPSLLHIGLNIVVWRVDLGYAEYQTTNRLLGALAATVDFATLWVLFSAAWRGWRTGALHTGTAVLGAAIVLVTLQHIPAIGGLNRLRTTWFSHGFMWTSADIASIVLTLALTILLLRRLGADRREKVRLSGEMAAARLVQESLLEGSAASAAGFKVESVYLPASEVGGDFYYSMPADDGSLLVVIGDVSGKGLRAALLVGHLSGALSNERSRRPAEILAHLNDSLTGKTHGGGFVTCCCVRFDPGGTVTIANAGHLAPYLQRCEMKVEAGLPLGLVPGVEYGESTAILGAGESLVLVPDGVVEAANARGELFGFERTREMSGRPAAEIAAAAKSRGQNDDITVVTVRRRAG
jgi:hypothetical protein